MNECSGTAVTATREVAANQKTENNKILSKRPAAV